MKWIISLLLISESSFAYTYEQAETKDLICMTRYTDSGTATSCVSKASIEKDKAELELIKLQIEALKKAKSK